MFPFCYQRAAAEFSIFLVLPVPVASKSFAKR